MELVWIIIFIILMKITMTSGILSYDTKLLQPLKNGIENENITQQSISPIINQIDLRILYDGTAVTQMGIFEFPELKNCNHDMKEMDNDLKEMKIWKGQVKKYQPITTKFEVALCEIRALYGFCVNNGVTNTRTSREKELHMSHTQCWKLTQQLYTIYDEQNLTLHKTRENFWETTEKVRYVCSWAKTVRKTTYKITVRIYPAQIIGDSRKIEQHVFTEDCQVKYPKDPHAAGAIQK